MNLIDRLRLWWQERTGEEETPFDGDAPAWFISLMVHLALLVVLTIILLVPRNNQITLMMEMPDISEEVVIPEEFYFSKDEQEEIGANSSQGVDAAMAVAPEFSEMSDVPTEIDEVPENPTVEVALNQDIPTGPNVDKTLPAVKGAAGVGTTGASGAIDRITMEILRSLEQRNTLVVWIFDQSGSLSRQREQIHKRFNRIYHELGVIEESGHQAFAKHDNEAPLLTSIMAFGKQVQVLTEQPTTDVAEMKAAIESIKNDPSGIEMVFSSVRGAVEKYKDYRVPGKAPGGMRNVMIVVFSDEVGDDERALEPTIESCRRWEMPVYVVGVPAPFGRTEALVRYVHPDEEVANREHLIPVRQGPESVMPERLKLFFPESKGRMDPLERLDSGYGPFSLTRLCFETGGIYFAVHPNRDAATRAEGRALGKRDTEAMSAVVSHFFDPGIMRRYRPDYVSLEDYQRLLMENKARAALVQAARISWISQLKEPRTQFPVVSEGALNNELTEAQKQAAVLEPKLASMQQALEMGLEDRPKLTKPRWQAGYDLAMGRVLAARVRTEGYNQMLAKLKGGRKFENEKNDTWTLVPSPEISTGSRLQSMADDARMYLERVTREHAGTPWAMLAEKELETPLGWAFKEGYTGVNEPRQGIGNGNGNPAPDPMDKINRIKKPRIDPAKIKL